LSLGRSLAPGRRSAIGVDAEALFGFAAGSLSASSDVACSQTDEPGCVKVAEVMNTEVITVGPSARLKDVARLLVEQRISGVPVLDEDGTVLGVVSEADILVKERGRAGTTLFHRALELDTESEKYGARDAADAMTTPAVTIRPTRSVSEAASLMLERGVNRLPVVDPHGRLVGIVTRADLVRAFVRDDAEIEREIRDDVVLKTCWRSPDRFHLEVRNGEVTLDGRVADADAADMLLRFVERVPGVVNVRSQLSW
jgi:CBS domain-containing protein